MGGRIMREGTGKIRAELRDIAVFVRADGKPADPEAGDLDLTAGWGHPSAHGNTAALLSF